MAQLAFREPLRVVSQLHGLPFPGSRPADLISAAGLEGSFGSWAPTTPTSLLDDERLLSPPAPLSPPPPRTLVSPAAAPLRVSSNTLDIGGGLGGGGFDGEALLRGFSYAPRQEFRVFDDAAVRGKLQHLVSRDYPDFNDLFMDEASPLPAACGACGGHVGLGGSFGDSFGGSFGIEEEALFSPHKLGHEGASPFARFAASPTAAVAAQLGTPPAAAAIAGTPPPLSPPPPPPPPPEHAAPCAEQLLGMWTEQVARQRTRHSL